jgi:hypothetical protein
MMIKISIFAATVFMVCSFSAVPVLSADKTMAPGIADCDSMPMSKEGHVSFWSRPGFDMKQFGTMIIEKPGVSSLKPSSRVNYDEFAGKFHIDLTDRIKTAGFFKDVKWNASASNPNTLILKTEFTEMNPGSTAARWAVGFGAGRGAITLKAALVADSREVVMCWQSRHMDASSPSGNLLLTRGMSVLADRLFLHIDRLYNTGR